MMIKATSTSARPLAALAGGRHPRLPVGEAPSQTSSSGRAGLPDTVIRAAKQDAQLHRLLNDDSIGPLLARLGKSEAHSLGKPDLDRPGFQRLRFLFIQSDVDVQALRASIDELVRNGLPSDSREPVKVCAPVSKPASSASPSLVPSPKGAGPLSSTAKTRQTQRMWLNSIVRWRRELASMGPDDAERASHEFKASQLERKLHVLDLEVSAQSTPAHDPQQTIWKDEIERITKKIQMERAAAKERIPTPKTSPPTQTQRPDSTPPTTSSTPSFSSSAPAPKTPTTPPSPTSKSYQAEAAPSFLHQPKPASSEPTRAAPARPPPAMLFADIFNLDSDTPPSSDWSSAGKKPVEKVPSGSTSTPSPTAPPTSDSPEIQAPGSSLVEDTKAKIEDLQEIVVEEIEVAKEAVIDKVENARGTVANTLATTKGKVAEAVEDVKEATPDVGEKAEEVKAQAVEIAKDVAKTTEHFRGKVADVAQETRDRASEAVGKAEEKAEEMKEVSEPMIEEVEVKTAEAVKTPEREPAPTVVEKPVSSTEPEPKKSGWFGGWFSR